MAYSKRLEVWKETLVVLTVHYFPERVCWRSTAPSPGGHGLVPRFGTLYSFSVFNSLTV